MRNESWLRSIPQSEQA